MADKGYPVTAAGDLSRTILRLVDMGNGQFGLSVVSSGNYAAPTHAAVAIQGSTAALAANTARRYALFQNDSDTIIYLKFGAAAVVNEGIRLNANGGSFEMSGALGNLYTGIVYANHGGGATNKTLLVLEGV